MRPVVELYVVYRGFDPDIDRKIESIAQVFGGLRTGSGFSFADGERDISYAFVARSNTERKKQGGTGFANHLTRHRVIATVDAERFVSTVLGEVGEVSQVSAQRFWTFHR